MLETNDIFEELEEDCNFEYWNHRVILRQHGYSDLEKKQPYFEYGIHEVHYDRENEVVAWTKDSMSPYGETLEILIEDIEWFRKACKKPVLIETELEAACKKRETNRENA